MPDKVKETQPSTKYNIPYTDAREPLVFPVNKTVVPLEGNTTNSPLPTESADNEYQSSKADTTWIDIGDAAEKRAFLNISTLDELILQYLP